MFCIEKMMGLLAIVVVCSAAQNSKTDVTTYYRVEIKKIDKTDFTSNENGVFMNLENNDKKYFEIKERYLQRKNGSSEECEVKLVSCDESMFDPNRFTMKGLVVLTNKEIQVVEDFNGFEFKWNTFKLNSCLVKKCYYDNYFKSLMFMDDFDSTQSEKQVVLDENKIERLIFVLNFHIQNMIKKDSLNYEIPADSFMKNPVFEVLNEEEKDNKNSIVIEDELNINLSNDVLEENGVGIFENTNDVNQGANEENERNLIEKEKSSNEKSEDKTEKTNVSINNSMKFYTKIVIGVVVPIICLCILICVFIVYKKEITSMNVTQQLRRKFHISRYN